MLRYGIIFKGQGKLFEFWMRKGIVSVDYQTQMKIRRALRKPLVTYLFLAMQIGAFLLMTLDGGSTSIETLVRYGAKFNPLIVLGQWWRLITPMFLHIGVVHLIMNSVILYYLGAQLEAVFGHWRYFVLYFFGGIAGNAASFAFSESVSAGASTALFGLFGSTLVLAKLYRGNPAIQIMSRNFSLLILLNLLFGLFSTQVDLAGHMGGLAGGYLLSYVLTTPVVRFKLTQRRAVFGLLYIGLLIVLIVIGVGNYIWW